MLNDWGMRDTPKPAFLMKASEDLRELIDNDHDNDLMKVVNWLSSVGERGMPGVRPNRVTHSVGRTNPTPMDRRPVELFYYRTDSFNMSLVKEFGEGQQRTRVYEIEGAGYVVTRTTMNAWGEHHSDSLVSASSGPAIEKGKALELAKNLSARIDEEIADQGYA